MSDPEDEFTKEMLKDIVPKMTERMDKEIMDSFIVEPQCQHCSHYDDVKAKLDMAVEALESIADDQHWVGYLTNEELAKQTLDKINARFK